MDKIFMDIAYKEAEKAFKLGEVPVGCVITQKASKKLNTWRLDDCDMYITLDPCIMCASAIKQARIKNLFCGTNNFYNNINIINSIFNERDNNCSVNFVSNLDEDRCSKILKEFFANKRC